ncbi:MAG: hypothetical protein M1491_08225 [Deltaproteobacteria bacterium]|nr:hypothetical protein [Deltaproteobacteria bacterium]MCL5278033.1 hypothetical protein [Deltaproteobacteria bacterium]
MDAYFASVERILNPSLRDKPIAVIGTGKRTVVLSPSYGARKYGVKTGMTIGEAKKRYTDIIFVRAHIDEYKRYSQLFVKILCDFTPLVEPYSIDEAYMDVTGTEKLIGNPLIIARNLKHRIKQELIHILLPDFCIEYFLTGYVSFKLKTSSNPSILSVLYFTLVSATGYHNVEEERNATAHHKDYYACLEVFEMRIHLAAEE